jgi:hypothetical protein
VPSTVLNMIVSLEEVKKCFRIAKRDKRLRQPWMGEIVEVTSVEAVDTTETCPSIEYRIKVKDWMLNMYGVVHGGCVATIVDGFVTWASIVDPKLWRRCKTLPEVRKTHAMEMGKLRNFSISYLRPIPRNTTIALIATIHNNTPRSITLSFKIIDPATKKHYVVGTHDQAKKPFATSKL